MARHERAKDNRKRLALFLVAVAVLVAGGIAVSLTGRVGDAADAETPASSSESSTVALLAEEGSATVNAAPVVVEVPDVRGKPLAEAEMVMRVAGFVVERKMDATASPDPDRRVTGQTPAAGAKLESGAVVVLTHTDRPSKKAPAKPATTHVVVIDPWHQGRSNTSLEPIGPGSSETKAKVTGGTQGVQTRMPEYEFALQLSNRVKKRLEAQGVKVVMTRTSHDVDVSNVQRAQIANKAGADLALRVHADGNVNREMHGMSTLFPLANQWTKPIVARSKTAAQHVQAATVRETRAKDLGIKGRGDLTGFNWSKVPVILVEAGFLSNPAEDELLASPAYQDKLASGIASGVMAYLKG